MLIRRRPLARAAMLGGAGYMAYRAGRGVQQQSTHEAEQDAQLADLQQQGGAQASQPPYPAPPPPAAAAPAPADATAQRIEALSKLKELLDAGVLSQAEFDAQKQKLLQG